MLFRSINKYSPHAHVSQMDYVWYVGATRYSKAEEWTPGYGNVRFSPDGTLDTENEELQPA